MLGAAIKAHRDVLVDVALGSGVFAVIATAMAADLKPGRTPDVFAYLIAIGLGLLMLVRRRYPGLALAATVVGLMGYYVAGYSPVGMAVPVAAALYSAAENGRLRLAIGTAAALILFTDAYRLVVARQSPAYLLGFELAVTVTVMAAAIALGDSIRTRRLLRAEAEGRERMSATEREHEAERRVEAERMRIARDVHDVLAHTVAVVSLQASVAAEALADDPGAARAALATIRSAASEANRQLRATVGLLRRAGEADQRAPTGGLDDLDRLVRTTADSGPEVNFRIEGQRAQLPVEVDTTAYRIIQESLTNCLRHGQARHIDLLLSYGPECLEIRVTDDGQGASGDGGGSGLTGMRERAALLGGKVWAGNVAGGGFAVRASLPVAGLR